MEQDVKICMFLSASVKQCHGSWGKKITLFSLRLRMCGFHTITPRTEKKCACLPLCVCVYVCTLWVKGSASLPCHVKSSHLVYYVKKFRNGHSLILSNSLTVQILYWDWELDGAACFLSSAPADTLLLQFRETVPIGLRIGRAIGKWQYISEKFYIYKHEYLRSI